MITGAGRLVRQVAHPARAQPRTRRGVTQKPPRRFTLWDIRPQGNPDSETARPAPDRKAHKAELSADTILRSNADSISESCRKNKEAEVTGRVLPVAIDVPIPSQRTFGEQGRPGMIQVFQSGAQRAEAELQRPPTVAMS